VLEPPRIGLPNLVGQGELLARTRGAQAGAEAAARDTIAAGLRHEATQRAEELPPTERVEGVNRDPKGRDGQGSSGQRREHGDDPEPDDGEDGHLVDVMA
jgi:hypothetical protein